MEDAPAGVGDVSPAALAILDGIRDPVVLLDRRRRVVAANRAAREVLQVRLIGRDLAQSIRHPGALEAVDAVIGGAPRASAEISLAAPVPREFTVVAARLEGDGSGGDAAAVLVLHDETGAKRAEQMRADFVANVSHELRSPLSALVGLIETLKGAAHDDAEARSRFLDIMHDESLRMSRLIDDLLSLSRVEINEHIQPTSAVDLRSVLGNIVEVLGPRARDRRMAFTVHIPDDLPPVAGERDELVQVFQNLIDNAIKYGGAGTPIRITARPIARMGESGDAGVAVAVADRGEGIAADHLPRLTERFYRIDKGRSRRLGGTGLGLAIVKHIVSRHRGRLDVESVAGEGSTFTVALPATIGGDGAGSLSSNGHKGVMPA